MWEIILYLIGGLASAIIGVTILESKTTTIKKIIGVLFFLGLGGMLLKNAWDSGIIIYG